MPRVHTERLVVGAADLDELGHVNNVRYVAWMQAAAIAHSAAQGWPMARYLAAGAGWIVRAHRIEYRRPAFAGDAVVVSTWVEDIERGSSTRRYRFRREADGQVLAEAETRWVYVDFASGRPRRVPDEVRAAFEPVAPGEDPPEDLGADPGD